MTTIAIMGAGHVGLATGAVLAEHGCTVYFYDQNETVIHTLQKGIVPFFEPELSALLHQQRHRLFFTMELTEALAKAEFVFVCVPTPASSDGTMNDAFVRSACCEAARSLTKTTPVVIKSTVLPGTCAQIQQEIRAELLPGVHAPVLANPEFLREGKAIQDMQKPDRIVIGSEDTEAARGLAELYAAFSAPVVQTSWASAEMIKLGANAFLSVKISFMNELANLCEQNGASIDDVAAGMGLDPRIGSDFLKAGAGYGGSCFPKDTSALIAYADKLKTPLSILPAARQVNEKRPLHLLDRAKAFIPSFQNRKVAVLGLSFKPDTDDTQNAPALALIEALEQEGARIQAYDPKASSPYLVSSIEEAITDADAAFLMTEWEEIRTIPLSFFKEKMACPLVIDGRNALSEQNPAGTGIIYLPVGMPAVHNTASFF